MLKWPALPFKTKPVVALAEPQLPQSEILVTKASLPPFEAYCKRLASIWACEQLTNHGPLVQELEAKLSAYFDGAYVVLVSNGTLALQLAVEALELRGAEVLTTPFSFVATTSSLLWQGATPVFADIEPESWMLDPERLEAYITPQTKGILATHLYGYPCAVEKLEQFAKKHNLTLFYDGAHAFGSRYKGRSLLTYGACSILSLHATKLFHTVEGGAIVTQNKALAERLQRQRNFGYNHQREIVELGINAKLSEFHAAMGLELLDQVPAAIHQRQLIAQVYQQVLLAPAQALGCLIQEPVCPPEAELNYAYYPVLFPDEATLLVVLHALEAEHIYPRRYFYPLLSSLPYLQETTTAKAPLPVAEALVPRILCLPLYHTLAFEQVERIARIALQALRNQMKQKV
jgi:dTDP-4-amino-4,6-dideoxygalactose transaminase